MKPKRISTVFMIFFFSGCTIFNPYKDSFQCQDIDEGKCASIEKAYEYSLKSVEKGNKNLDCPDCEPETLEADNMDYEIYREIKFEKLRELIAEERPPIVVPPEVVRVLILSYTGDGNEMFGHRYAYFFASEPKWILSTGREQP